MTSRKTLLALASCALLFASHAHADNHMAAPSAKSQGAASYVSGGITIDERDAMKAVSKDYNLKMLFALSGGNYVANVKVTIKDRKGKPVLDAVSEGPWMYVKLPAGAYKISADYQGKTVTKSATVSAKKGANVNFFWPGAREQQDD